MKTRKKTSIIWQISDEEFIDLIKNSKTMSSVLKFFGLENKGNNYQTCKSRINELKLDTSHFLNRNDSSNFTRRMTLDIFKTKLVKNSNISRCHLKKHLLRFNLLEYKCSCCNNTGIWNNKPLSLQLEHKNGISNDNRLENLDFLCPNCHSQTDTYAGKRHRKPKKLYFCKCGKTKTRYSEECNSCSGKKKRKYKRPTKEELEKEISNNPMDKVALKFGLKSDNTIRKWCESYNIDYKKLSPFSHLNKKAIIKIPGRIFPSKYLHVSYQKMRNKWAAHIKSKDKKQTILFKRFDTELEAAQEVAKQLNSQELIIRKTNI